MKRLVRVLTALSFLLPLLGTTIAKAQDNLPPLEMPTATSATALDGLQKRQISTDFDFVFLPAGAGGEQSDDTWSYSATSLQPIRSEIAKNVNQATLPAYALVEPNRSIETQTDPQRLTVIAPVTSQPQ
jgi:hypothetical protein